MRHAERFSRGAEFDNGSISQKHQNKGCCRVHISDVNKDDPQGQGPDTQGQEPGQGPDLKGQGLGKL